MLVLLVERALGSFNGALLFDAHGECSWVQVLSLVGSAVWMGFASGGIGTRDQCFSQNGGAEVDSRLRQYMSVKCLLEGVYP